MDQTLKTKITKIEKRIVDLYSKVRRINSTSGGTAPPFTKKVLKGRFTGIVYGTFPNQTISYLTYEEHENTLGLGDAEVNLISPVGQYPTVRIKFTQNIPAGNIKRRLMITLGGGVLATQTTYLTSVPSTNIEFVTQIANVNANAGVTFYFEHELTF